MSLLTGKEVQIKVQTSPRRVRKEAAGSREGANDMAKRKHPGVVLLPPETNGSGAWWRVRYVDPDSGKRVRVTLDRTLRTKAMREDHAVKLSERNGKRRRELEDGAVRATGTTLEEAERRFYASLAKKRPATIATYGEGTRRFRQWAEANGVRTCDHLTRGRVVAFREWLLAEDVAPATFNKRLRAVKRQLSYWVDADLCPKLDHSDLKRLKQEEAPTELREFLRPAQVKRLLEASQRHRSRFLQESHARFCHVLRGELEREFAPQLARTRVSSTPLLDTLDLLASFEAWHRLRCDQGLGLARASCVVAQSLLAAFAAAGVAPASDR